MILDSNTYGALITVLCPHQIKAPPSNRVCLSGSREDCFWISSEYYASRQDRIRTFQRIGRTL